MLNRRSFIAIALCAPTRFLSAEPRTFHALPAALGQLEHTNGGRLGVAVLDTGTGERSGHRANERFPMCSTFKFLLASAVLQRVDRRLEKLDHAIAIPPKPLLPNSPLSEPNAGGAMTVSALCHAALIRSDNTAANLLLESIGGPLGISGFARSIGDTVTRLDRTEMSLNQSLAGDPRDTTSPEAMLGDLKSVLLGIVLSSGSREQLTRWMEANLTGLERLRAKLPAGWWAADKAGSNGEHTSNDIAVLWPAAQASCHHRGLHHPMHRLRSQARSYACRDWQAGEGIGHLGRQRIASNWLAIHWHCCRYGPLTLGNYEQTVREPQRSPANE